MRFDAFNDQLLYDAFNDFLVFVAFNAISCCRESASNSIFMSAGSTTIHPILLGGTHQAKLHTTFSFI